MADALLILRTPLQAHLTLQVLSLEGITKYDLIYLTQQNSEEDQFYYAKLSSGPGLRRYMFIPPKRFDVFNHLSFRRHLHECFKDFRRDHVVIGSIDALVVSALARRQKTSSLITVDDGTANINKSGNYHNPNRSIRYKLYSHLLGTDDLSTICKRIVRHYTLFSGLENIVGKDKLRYLPSVCPDIENNKVTEGLRTYFIGQPLNPEYRDMMTAGVKEALGDQKIDLYVRHPREEMPLNLGTPFLIKNGLIAEDAILRDAAGHNVCIISGFSTATMNLAPFVASSTVLLHSGIDQDSANEMERVALLCGCTVRHI